MAEMTDRFEGFYTETIDYFMNIRLNNNKQWYEAHKEEFKKYCKIPFTLFSNEMTAHVQQYIPDLPLKAHVSRIFKDKRHYHGGMLYNDHLWVSSRPYERQWQNMPLFWFGLSPDSFDYGMGYFDCTGEVLQMFRDKIDANPARFREKVIAPYMKQDAFVNYGDLYKRKKGDHDPDIMEWYQLKSIGMMTTRPLDRGVFSRDIIERVKADFDKISGIYKYLMEMHL